MIKIPRGKVAVRPIFDRDVSPGGIIIPEMAKERCDQGIVKYLGDDLKEDLQIGDYVIFSGYVGTLLNIQYEGKLIVMPEEFINAKVVGNIECEIPGMYFRDYEGHYFQATYEQAMEMIGEAVRESAWATLHLKVKGRRLNPDEYEVKGAR